MKTCLVSLVGEQTIPNILVARHYKPEILWFISTEGMEKEHKTKCITNTLKISECLPSDSNVEILQVNQESLIDCINQIESFIDKNDEPVEYIVNITGATKVMALAAYEVFREIGQKVKIVYIPLGKNEFFQIFPRKKPLKISEVKERLTLEEYLTGYGFRITNKKDFQKIISNSDCRASLSKWILYNYEQLKGLLGFFYLHLKDGRDQRTFILRKTFDRTFSPVEKELLDKCAFEVNGTEFNKTLKKDETCFLTGGWLEDYVFSEVNTLVSTGHFNDSMIGIKIESLNGASNELDIAFMKDNFFYSIECKTLGEKGEKNIIRDEVYKKGALSTLLGRGEKRAFICTTHKTISDLLAGRGKDYGIEVFNIEQVKCIKDILLKRFAETTR